MDFVLNAASKSTIFGDSNEDKGREGSSSFRPKAHRQPKVERYRPGVVPEWAKGGDDEDDDGEERGRQAAAAPTAAEPSSSDVRAIIESVKRRQQPSSHPSSDAQASATVDDGDDPDARRARARARARERAKARKESADTVAGVGLSALRRGAEAGQARADDNADGDDDAMVLERRSKPEEDANDDSVAQVLSVGMAPIRQRSAGAARVHADAESSDSESDSSSSSSTSSSSASSSSEDDAGLRPTGPSAAFPGMAHVSRRLPKPVFRRKEERWTIRAQEAEEARQAAKEEDEEKRLEERKAESRALVAAAMAREKKEAALAAERASSSAGLAAGSMDVGRPDDRDDPEQEEAEFELWKLRELRRIQQERDVRARQAQEQEETERRRRMTDKERREEDRRLEAQGLKVFHKEKTARKFLQKFHHRGAFYMDESSIRSANDVRRRDNESAPTGADTFDKQRMPQVMQVRDFGKRSRTKWTHLAAEDTSKDPHALGRPRSGMRREPVRRGGMGDVDGASVRRRKSHSPTRR